jgi:hypothetical protein
MAWTLTDDQLSALVAEFADERNPQVHAVGLVGSYARVYLRLVRQAAGDDSEWTRQHKIAVGVDPAADRGAAPGANPPAEPAGTRTPWQTRAIAALHLYCESVSHLRPILSPTYRDTIEATVDRITTSPWIH